MCLHEFKDLKVGVVIGRGSFEGSFDAVGVASGRVCRRLGGDKFADLSRRQVSV
jgi:hypothetical protein